MTLDKILASLIAILLSIYLLFPLMDIFAKSYYDLIGSTSDLYDLWSVDSREFDSYRIFEYLSSEGMVYLDLSFSDFDYIYVLTEQLCSMTEWVDFEVALAIVAAESNFNTDCKTGSAKGLMQLIPLYHSKRMSQFVERDHLIDLDDFYDPRLNIATGIDYLNEILDQTDGDLIYSLMWYNQGGNSASIDYLYKSYISPYANRVVYISENIKKLLKEEATQQCSLYK